MRLELGGVEVELPRGWSGRLFTGRGGAVTLHAASYPLPLDDGAFGDRSTSRMATGTAFAALTEYLPGPHLRAGAGLFASKRIPAGLDPTAFSERRLAHPRPDQAGAQQFFTASDRPFCLYVVLAGVGRGTALRPGRHPQLPALTLLLRSLRVAART